MKQAFLLLVTSLVAFTEVHGQSAKLNNLQAYRYTRQGAEGVLVESGFLYTNTKSFESVSPSLHPEEVLGMTAATLTAINGKYVAIKATIDTHRQLSGEAYISGYTFSKASYQITGGMAVYIVDFAGSGDSTAPSASLKVSKSKLAEGSKAKAKIIVTLNKPATSDMVVRYKLKGTAKLNSDYRIRGNESVIQIRKGKKKGAVTVLVVDDKTKEKTEKIKINLLAGGQYKLGAKKRAAISIADNDK